MRRIETDADIADGLRALLKTDPRLGEVADGAGPLPLRLTQPGFSALTSIVVSQQVSRASADAILARLTRLVDPLDAPGIIEAGEEVFREAGLSRPKQRTLSALAAAVADGSLDLEGLCDLDAGTAMARLTSIHGIGPWTAEVYLMFAAGHPDIFPAHDVALRSAVGHAFAMQPRPSEKMLRAMAESWAPWRSVAARLFWAYYRNIRGREAAPPA